jgi:hypothetical protein
MCYIIDTLVLPSFVRVSLGHTREFAIYEKLKQMKRSKMERSVGYYHKKNLKVISVKVNFKRFDKK